MSRRKTTSVWPFFANVIASYPAMQRWDQVISPEIGNRLDGPKTERRQIIKTRERNVDGKTMLEYQIDHRSKPKSLCPGGLYEEAMYSPVPLPKRKSN